MVCGGRRSEGGRGLGVLIFPFLGGNLFTYGAAEGKCVVVEGFIVSFAVNAFLVSGWGHWVCL